MLGVCVFMLALWGASAQLGDQILLSMADKGAQHAFRAILPTHKMLTAWQPNLRGSWFMLGQHLQDDNNALADAVDKFRDNPINEGSSSEIAQPTSFDKIWANYGWLTAENCTVLRPVCPAGFVSLSDIIHNGDREVIPSILYGQVRCVRESLTLPCAYDSAEFWNNFDTGSQDQVGMWEVDISGAGIYTTSTFFRASTAVNVPPTAPIHCIRNDVIFRTF